MIVSNGGLRDQPSLTVWIITQEGSIVYNESIPTEHSRSLLSSVSQSGSKIHLIRHRIILYILLFNVYEKGKRYLVFLVHV